MRSLTSDDVPPSTVTEPDQIYPRTFLPLWGRRLYPAPGV